MQRSAGARTTEHELLERSVDHQVIEAGDLRQKRATHAFCGTSAR